MTPHFQDALDDYLATLGGRHYSSRSIALYDEDIRRLAALLPEAAPESLTAHDIRRALASLHGRGYAAKSLARMLSAWRGFYVHLGRQGRVRANPCLGVRPPKGPKRLPHTLSPDELSRMLAGAIDDDPIARRDQAMFELMYSSGLRLAELVGLNLGDIDLAQGEATVTGKGRKTRIVPVGRLALEALRGWLAVRDGVSRDERALFVGARGQRIAPRVVQARLKRLALLRGIGQRVHPHALRHSFASHVLQSSGDLRAVQEMLGHASLSTTQVYTHLDYQHLAQVYDQAHPRAKKKD
jgi:integrase/recombinase XerC